MIYKSSLLSALQNSSICPSSTNGCRGCKDVKRLEIGIKGTMKKLDQLLTNLQKAKAEMNYWHSPIVDKLPAEILSSIFEDCVANSIDLESDKTKRQSDVLTVPLKLSQVCRSWKQTALSTGKMWSKVFISLSSCYGSERVELLRQWMERTRGVPFDIFICVVHKNQEIYSTMACWTDEDTQHDGALEVLAAFSGQWKSVHLQLPYAILEPFCRTLRGIPDLDHLRITLIKSREENNDLVVQPRLIWSHFQASPRHVTLNGVGLDLNSINVQWGAVMTAHLKSFKVTKCMNLFKSAPMLVSATLEDIVYIDEVLEGTSITQHSNIRHLSFSAESSRLFRYLRFPNLITLSFKCGPHSPDWYGTIYDFLTSSSVKLERLALLNIVFQYDYLCRLLRLLPSLEHLHLAPVVHPFAYSDITQPFLRQLAKKTLGIEDAFLPSLKTFKYEVCNENFPWELVPDIFDSEERRLLTSFTVAYPRKSTTALEALYLRESEMEDTDDEVLKSRLIPRDVLPQILTIRRKGVDIYYENHNGEDLLKQSIESAGMLEEA